MEDNIQKSLGLLVHIYSKINQCKEEARKNGAVKIDKIESIGEKLNELNHLLLEVEKFGFTMKDCLIIANNAGYGNWFLTDFDNSKELIDYIKSGSHYGKIRIFKELELSISDE